MFLNKLNNFYFHDAFIFKYIYLNHVIANCKTIGLGEPAQPSRGGLSHIYNEGVQRYIIRTHTYTYTEAIQSNTEIVPRPDSLSGNGFAFGEPP